MITIHQEYFFRVTMLILLINTYFKYKNEFRVNNITTYRAKLTDFIMKRLFIVYLLFLIDELSSQVRHLV